jgi:hypothetical protein
MPKPAAIIVQPVGFADYRYYAVLAGKTSYTPPPGAVGIVWAEKLALNYQRVEIWTGAEWISSFNVETLRCSLAQDAGQNMRITNTYTIAYKISPQGVIWRLGAEFGDYHYYASLAVAATYTPPAKMLGVFWGERIATDYLTTEVWSGAYWVSPTVEGGNMTFLAQDAGQNIRIKNANINYAKGISLSGVIWK